MRREWLSRFLDSIADRGRDLINHRPGKGRESRAESLCAELLSGRGEASGMAIARDVFQRYRELDEEGRVSFFTVLGERFGPDTARLRAMAAAYASDGSAEHLERLQAAAAAPRQELFRRLNMAPAGTAGLVLMRGDLRRLLGRHPALAAVDRDMQHLLASWFNRGFLNLERIDWTTPAVTLEKLIQYETVHAIRSWDDLHRRLKDDRRCFAFMHPAMPREPLIFVEVALTKGTPGSIQPLIDPASPVLPSGEANNAVFYSINNTQPGLSGISFGSFLIKQVVAELAREFRAVDTFVTLSPVPGFASSLRRAADTVSPDSRLYSAVLASHRVHLSGTPAQDGSVAHFVAALDKGFADSARRFTPVLNSLAIAYLTLARQPGGGLADPVARFHLSNGASLERIRPFGDLSENGYRQSFGLMVNYRYNPDDLELNHERYVGRGEIPMSRAVARSHRRVQAVSASLDGFQGSKRPDLRSTLEARDSRSSANGPGPGGPSPQGG